MHTWQEDPIYLHPLARVRHATVTPFDWPLGWSYDLGRFDEDPFAVVHEQLARASALVYLTRSRHVVSCDRDGRFVLEGIPPGNRKVTVAHPSVGWREARVEVAPAETVVFEVRFR